MPVSALHGGDGATNRLRVVTVGSVATLYVNGEKFRDVKGQPPARRAADRRDRLFVEEGRCPLCL